MQTFATERYFNLCGIEATLSTNLKEAPLPRASDKPDPRATSDVDRQIGVRIRARRLEIAMSQEHLASLIGVTFQQVQKYEKGVNRVAASTLVEIASALGVQVPALLPKGAQAGAHESFMLDGEGFADLAAVFSQLNDDGRRLLLSTGRTFTADQRLAKVKRK